jgi:membrane associated rhomboid family serine protease
VTLLSGATELPSIPLRDGDHTLEPDVSREAAEAIHADAVRLNRSELVFIIPTVILAVAATGAIVFDPREFWMLGAPAAALIFRVIQWGAEWARLRRSDPHRYITAEFRQETVNRQAAAAHEAQRAVTRLVVTPALIAGIAAVTAVQFFVPGVLRSIDLAALVKQSTWHGEWWRLLTASYLHGNLMHLVGNLSALFVLGGLVEMYDRRLSVALAYLAGVIGGSLSSLLLVKGSAVGASAGILGIAGYLVVFFLHQHQTHSGWLLSSNCWPCWDQSRSQGWSATSSSTTQRMPAGWSPVPSSVCFARPLQPRGGHRVARFWWRPSAGAPLSFSSPVGSSRH